MKKTNKVAWSFALALIMILSCTTLAFAAWNENGGGSEVTGNSTVTNPIYEVILPSDMTFALDPFELRGGDSIAAETYPIINNGNIPVLVGVQFQLDVVTGVTDKTSSSAVATSAAVKDKQVYMGVTFGKDITAVDPNQGTVTGVTYSSVTSTYAAFAIAKDTPTTQTKLALKERTYTGTDKDIPGEITSKSAVAFTFSGKVNPGAAWQPGDVKVKAIYKLRALTTSEFATIATTSAIVTGTQIYTGAETVNTL